MGPARRVRPIIAIDGPAGAGKSTVAKKLADELGFVLLDTGALYRAIALAAKKSRLAWSEQDRVAELAQGLVANHALSVSHDATSGVRVFLEGQDISEAIRSAEIGMGASTVSAYPAVREALLDLQRQAGAEGGVVLEGRDIGTIVFPDADVKFFLTAEASVRAQRRYDELVARGAVTTYEETLRDVMRRDEQDTTRAVAPLRQASDAVRIDNTHLTIAQTVASMMDRVRAWMSR